MTFPAWGVAYQERYTPAASMQQSYNQPQANLHTSGLLSERTFRWPPGYGENLQQHSASLSSEDGSSTHLPEEIPFSHSPLRSLDPQNYLDERFTEPSHLHDPHIYFSNRFFNEDTYDIWMKQLSGYGSESHHQQWDASLSHEGLRIGPRDIRKPSYKSKVTNVGLRQLLSEMRCAGSLKSTRMRSIASVESYRHSPFTLDPMRSKLPSEHCNPDHFSVGPPKQIAQQNAIPETIKLAHTEAMYEIPHYYIPRLPDLTPPLMESLNPSLGPKYLLDRINKHFALNQTTSIQLIPELTKELDSKKSVEEAPTFASLPVLLSLSDTTDSLEAVADLNGLVDVVKDDASNEDAATEVEISNSSQTTPVVAEPAAGKVVREKQKKDSESGLPSYTSMIAQAILKRERSQSTLAEIYAYMEKNFPSLERRGTGWRNCVRHTLSLNDCFVKLSRSETGRSCNWAIHPSYLESFCKGDYRRRRAQRKQHRGLQWMDPMAMSALYYMRDHDLAVDHVSSVRFYHYPHNLSAMWSSAHASCHVQPPDSLLSHYPANTQFCHANMTGTHCIIPDCCCQARFRGYTAEYT